MGKRSKVTVIFALILVFGISNTYSDPITSEKCKKIGNLETLNDAIFVSGSLLQNGKDSFLILFNHNEIRLYEEGLEEYTAKSFDEKIVSIQLLEKNAPNIFLVATSHKIYFLDESLPKKDPLTFVEEIKKVIAIWNDNKVNYDLLIQYNESVNCYSIDGEEEWEEEYLLNEEILLLSTTENGEKIFGNTKNKIFLIDKNGYERTKKEFSEVFSVHPLSDGILIHCFDGEEYALKRIEFNKPNEVKSLELFDEPLNVIATGKQSPNLDIELIYFQEANGTFHVIHKGGPSHIDPFQLDPIKKIIIEDLDGELLYYTTSGGLRTYKQNVNEFVLVSENKIFICAVREELRIVEWEKDLDSFFIPKEQPKKDNEELTSSRMAIYNTGDKICFGNIFADYLWFWDRLGNVKRETIDEENYIIANEYLEDAMDKKDAIEFYKAQDIVQSWESLLNEKISESEQRAENYISQAEQEHENRNYVEACDMYYHTIEEYKKFKENNEIKEFCKQFLLYTNEIYKFINDYKFKIELFSVFFKLFDLQGYVGEDVIEEMENIDDDLRGDLTNFEANHLEAFESYLQEIENEARSDEENGDLESAREKYSALIESYQLINQHLGKYHIEKGNIEKKVGELENKVTELDSEIQEKERNEKILIGLGIAVFIVALYYFWKLKFSKSKEKEKIEEGLSDEEIKVKMELYEERKKDSKKKSMRSVVPSTAFSVMFSVIFGVTGLNFITVLFAFLAVLSALTSIYYYFLLSFYENNYKSLKERLKKQIPKREIEEKEEKKSEVEEEKKSEVEEEKFGGKIKKDQEISYNIEKKLREYEYDVALSFAGEDGEIADELNKALESKNIKVFFSEIKKDVLWGKSGTQYFGQVYGPKSRFFMPLISKYYPTKEWTDYELSIAKKEAKKRKTEFILPIRLDDTKILGLREDIIYLDYYKEGTEGIIKWFLKKLNKEKTNGREISNEFFLNPETGEPNFVAVVGNESQDYIDYTKEFVEILCFKYLGYDEVNPFYFRTKFFGNHSKIDVIRHDVKIDPYGIIIKGNEVTDHIKATYNLLLIGFIKDNALMKDLIEQRKSKVAWKTSDGEFEFIHDAFIEGKNTIICSGKNTDAILNGLRKLLGKLDEEDR